MVDVALHHFEGDRPFGARVFAVTYQLGGAVQDAADAVLTGLHMVGLLGEHELGAAREGVEAALSQGCELVLPVPVGEGGKAEEVDPGVDRVVEVSDDEVAAAMRMMFECTHNVCEGAGAAALAAATQEKEIIAGRKVAVIASGGNVDQSVFANVLKAG